MNEPDGGGPPSDLPARLRRELTLALGSARQAPDGRGLDDYIDWLRAAIKQLSGDDKSARVVHAEWVATRPRCARRAMDAAFRVHV